MYPLPSILAVTLLATLPLTYAQTTTASAAGATASPDGLIVPFTSTLPVCASLCGPLFDVQGKCTPPNIASVDGNCFCTDTRLTAFNNDGTTGVTTVCGSSSCTDSTSLLAIKTWYNTFCAANKGVTSVVGSSATATSTSTAKAKAVVGQSWLESHYKWVIMLAVIFFLIVGGWVGACLLRRRYIRNKEKEIEMLPPVALGPHQLQAMTGGYSEGIFDSNRGKQYRASHSKGLATTGGMNGKRESKGWLTKPRT